MMQCRMILHGQLDFDMSGVYDEEEEPVKVDFGKLRATGKRDFEASGGKWLASSC